MADILIIRNNCDPATIGTYNIGEGLAAHLQSLGHSVTDLADVAASPANVQYWLTSSANRTTKLVIGLDHGSSTGFFGELNSQVTQVIGTANVKDLTLNLHVATFACSTCANGGLGATEPVYVFTDPSSALFKTLKEVIWSYFTKLANGFTLETAENALRDAYAAHVGDSPLFSYNLARLLLCKKAAGMTLHSHNRLGGRSLIGTWSYANGGGRWIQIADTAIFTFNTVPGLVYTCTVGTDSLKGVMGYTTAPPNPGKGRFLAARAAAVTAPAADPMIAPALPQPQLALGNGNRMMPSPLESPARVLAMRP